MPFERLNWFCYPTDKDNSRIHRLRDGGASLEIAATLHQSGMQLGHLLFNQYAPGLPPPTPHLDHTDLLVLSTRPPLSDTKPERSRIRRSRTPLERLVLASAGSAFETCSRSTVKLATGLARQLSGEYTDRAEIEFFAYRKGTDPRAGRYKRLKALGQPRSHPAVDRRTSAYIVFTPALQPGGPGLLAVFGMTGNMTLAWSRILRSRFPGLIAQIVAAEKGRFVFAEISDAVIPKRPQTLSFVDEWQCDIVLDVAL